jgi:hypothetical protein
MMFMYRLIAPYRYLLLACLVLGAAIVVNCFLLQPPALPVEDGPIRPLAVRRYERIRLGMTLGEVQTAIGMPPGYYASGPSLPPSMGPTGHFIRQRGLPHEDLPDAAGRPAPGHHQKLTLEFWTWDEYWIWVALDKRGSVVGYYLLQVDDYTAATHDTASPPSFLDRLRALIGL